MIKLNLAQVSAELILTGHRAVESQLARFKRNLFSIKATLGSIVAGYGIKQIASSFLEAAVNVENYKTSLYAVLKDADKTKETFKDLNKWAALNPIDTTEAIASFVRLKTAAVKNTMEATKASADLATVMQVDAVTVSNAIISGNARALRRLGIILNQSGKQAIVQSGKVKVAVKKDIESIREGIVEVIQKNFAGAMTFAGDTWRGTMKTIGGMWTVFQQDLMGSADESGPFAALVQAIHKIRNAWALWLDSDDYKVFIKDMQDNVLDMFDAILAGMQHVLKASKIITTFVRNLPETAKYGILGKLFLGPRGALIGALGGLFMDIAKTVPKTDLGGILGMSKGDIDRLRKGELFKEQKITVTAEKTSAFDRLISSIGTLRDALRDPVISKGGTVGGMAPGADEEEATTDAVNKKYSELAETLAKALGISKEAAEIRIKNAQREGEYTAAAIERMKERNEKEQEYISLAKEGTSLFYSQITEQFNAGLMSANEYFDLVMKGFQQLKADLSGLGLDGGEFLNWPTEMKQRFVELQNATTSLLEPALTFLNKQLEEGRISSAEYTRRVDELVSSMGEIVAISPTLIDGVLARLNEEWEAGRLSTQRYVEALERLKISLAGMSGMQERISLAQINTKEATKGLFEEIKEGANLTAEALSETFSVGLMQGESFLGMLKQIGQEILTMALKKYILQPLFGMMFPMAEGGIVTGPTPALIGEAGPEAVIPLSGGAVPVRFEGGGKSENNITVICAIDRENIESIATETIGKRGDIVVAHVSRDFMENGVVKKTFRR